MADAGEVVTPPRATPSIQPPALIHAGNPHVKLGRWTTARRLAGKCRRSAAGAQWGGALAPGP